MGNFLESKPLKKLQSHDHSLKSIKTNSISIISMCIVLVKFLECVLRTHCKHKVIEASGFSRVATPPSGPGVHNYHGFTITIGHPRLGRVPMEGSARRKDVYLTEELRDNGPRWQLAQESLAAVIFLRPPGK
jgi:hypothetical protein